MIATYVVGDTNYKFVLVVQNRNEDEGKAFCLKYTAKSSSVFEFHARANELEAERAGNKANGTDKNKKNE